MNSASRRELEAPGRRVKHSICLFAGTWNSAQHLRANLLGAGGVKCRHVGQERGKRERTEGRPRTLAAHMENSVASSHLFTPLPRARGWVDMQDVCTSRDGGAHALLYALIVYIGSNFACSQNVRCDQKYHAQCTHSASICVHGVPPFRSMRCLKAHVDMRKCPLLSFECERLKF
jgi:hypothetical protein